MSGADGAAEPGQPDMGAGLRGCIRAGSGQGNAGPCVLMNHPADLRTLQCKQTTVAHVTATWYPSCMGVSYVCNR